MMDDLIFYDKEKYKRINYDLSKYWISIEICFSMSN